MQASSTNLTPGRYQYTYPSFVDRPQLITVHFLTADGQQAFVSYPKHPNHKAAQLIPVRWFASVVLVRLAEQDLLIPLIETFLTGWSVERHTIKRLPTVKLRSVPVPTERLVA
jgi:hypothetical protein